MRRISWFLIVAGLFAEDLSAQLDLLTFREAESLVERVPTVIAAREQGACPLLSGYYESEPEEVSFQVRSGCGDTGGQLIENYTVNRRTGAVRLWGDNPTAV